MIPAHLTPRQLNKIIEGASEDITDLREKLPTVKNRIEKNLIYARIASREGFMKKAQAQLETIS